MTHLRQIMIEEPRRRNFADSTIVSGAPYVKLRRSVGGNYAA